MWLKGLIVVLVMMTLPAQAAVEAGVGSSGSCFRVVSDIQRNWFEVKRVMVPLGEEYDRPKDDDFFCRVPTRDSTPARTGTSSALECFKDMRMQGLGYCCDSGLTECAQLNPYLFPEFMERRQPKEETYKPPKSDWVRPPSDNDQWKSN